MEFSVDLKNSRSGIYKLLNAIYSKVSRTKEEVFGEIILLLYGIQAMHLNASVI